MTHDVLNSTPREWLARSLYAADYPTRPDSWACESVALRDAYRAAADRISAIPGLLPTTVPTDLMVDAAARLLNRRGWTCTDGTHEPGSFDDCPQCRIVCTQLASEVLGAALGRANAS